MIAAKFLLATFTSVALACTEIDLQNQRITRAVSLAIRFGSNAEKLDTIQKLPAIWEIIATDEDTLTLALDAVSDGLTAGGAFIEASLDAVSGALNANRVTPILSKKRLWSWKTSLKELAHHENHRIRKAAGRLRASTAVQLSEQRFRVKSK